MKFLSVHLSNANLASLKRRLSQKDSTFQLRGTRFPANLKGDTAVTEAATRVVVPHRPYPGRICGYTVESRFDDLSINEQIGSWFPNRPGYRCIASIHFH